jgi:hypothetical protein
MHVHPRLRDRVAGVATMVPMAWRAYGRRARRPKDD